ncbi:MAG TPA: NlpC/P60 family protein, partial [Puia sp.]
MKNRFILLLLLINLAGCNAFRPASPGADNLSAATADQPSAKKPQPEFIQNISTGSSESKATTKSASTGTAGTSVKTSESHLYRASSSKTTASAVERDAYDPLQFKFAILTNSPVEELTNLRLLVFMDQWYGVPYHYGGCSKDGIDCSAFASLLLSHVYDVNQLPRISAEQYQATRRVPKKDLKEGDLVFFH